MKVKVEIDTKTFIRFWLVLLGFLIAGWVLYSIRMALVVFGASFLLALILSKPVDKIATRFPGRNRSLVTALAYFGVVVLLSLFAGLVVPPIIGQTSRLIQALPDLLEELTSEYSVLAQFIEGHQLESQLSGVITAISDGASQIIPNLGVGLVQSLGSIFTVLLAGVMVFFLTFFMLVEGPAWVERLWKLMGVDEKTERVKKVVDEMYNVITNYFAGQVAVATVACLVSGVGVLLASLIFDIPIELVLPSALTTFVFSMIPVFGSTIGLVLVTFLLALNNFQVAIIYFVLYLVYQQIEGNVIAPKIQANKINLSPLLILMAIIIGTYLFGVIGGIISIPVAGCLKVALGEYSNDIFKQLHRLAK